jgi:predicted nucleotidyltransferase
MTSRIDPAFIPPLSDLAHALRTLQVPFCLIGALVPDLLLDTAQSRKTNDADVTVVVNSLVAFEHLKHRLAAFGFVETPRPHRLQHRDGGLVDVLPFSPSLAPDGRLELDPGTVLNMAGFNHVVPNAVNVSITADLTLPVTPVPLYILLKLVAFGDRHAPKDLVSVLHCLEHYLEGDERRYGLDYGGDGVPFEYTCAHLAGLDAGMFLDESLAPSVRAVTDRFTDVDASIVGIVAREQGHAFVEP